MNLRRLDLSLLAVQLVGLATLARSIAYDRWITVLAACVMLIGATAARRGRSWGVGISLGASAAFPVAWLIGIAPAWFCIVGAIGALPFLLASRAFAKVDKAATALLAGAGIGVGAVAALLWREYAWSVFEELPSLSPSGRAQHDLVLLPILLGVALAMGFARRKSKDALVTPGAESGATTGSTTRYRVAEESGVRVAGSLSAEHDAMEELEDELDAERPYARRAQR